MSCRLLYLVGQLRPGGLERQLCYLLQVINRDRYKPAVAVWNYHEEDPYVSDIHTLGVSLYPLSPTSSGRVKLKAFRRLVRQLKPEVIYSYSFHTNFAAWWAALGTKAIAIGAVRSDFVRALKESGPWLGRLSARWPRAQIVNNLAAAEIARRSKGLFVPGQLYVVRNRVDLQHFQAVPLSTTGQVCILGVGSLIPITDRCIQNLMAHV